MTVFNVEQGAEGDWFSFFTSHIDLTSGDVVYDPPEEGAAEFRIRSMVPFWEEQAKSQKVESKFVLNPKTREMGRVEWEKPLPSVEKIKKNEDSWDFAITGIKNAFSAPGVPIECDRASKLKLLKMPLFLRFVTRVFQIISDSGIQQEKEKEKN